MAAHSGDGIRIGDACTANDGGDVVFTFAGGEVLVVEDIAKNQLGAADILV